MGMDKGIGHIFSFQAWLLGWALLFLVMPVSAMAQSAARDTEHVRPEIPHAVLRKNGVHITYPSAFRTIPILTAEKPQNQYALGKLAKYKGKVVIMPMRRGTSQAVTLKSYAHGENLNRWYALAGAGSGAIILMPDMPKDAQALRLQKRAKIGAAQLGIARDVGDGRVTLGYLRGATRRDRLAPHLSHAKRQNFAALTLMFKH
jgi:hypothetical protein